MERSTWETSGQLLLSTSKERSRTSFRKLRSMSTTTKCLKHSTNKKILGFGAISFHQFTVGSLAVISSGVGIFDRSKQPRLPTTKAILLFHRTSSGFQFRRAPQIGFAPAAWLFGLAMRRKPHRV